MTDQPQRIETSIDEKYLALFSYLFAPWVSLIIMFSRGDEYKRMHAYVQYHYMHALALFIVFLITNIVVVGVCLTPFYIAAVIYYGIQAYQGKPVVIPVLTDFLRNRGWLS